MYIKFLSTYHIYICFNRGGKETILYLGATCKARSMLYHTLMHYKFRLILQLRDKINFHGGNHVALLADLNFVANETRRYNLMLSQASKKWGGSEQKYSTFSEDIWEDGGTRASISSSQSVTRTPRNSHSTSSASTGSIHRWLSQRQETNEIRSTTSRSSLVVPRRSDGGSGSSRDTRPNRTRSHPSSVYDDDNGQAYPDEFGQSDLWERQGSSGI
jgi:hypothetical protein